MPIIQKYPNITLRQVAVLQSVNAHPNLKTCEVASELKVCRAVITRACDTLGSYGLVKRRRGDEDMRDVYVSATDDGIRIYNQLMER